MSLLLHDEVSLLVSGDYFEEHFVSLHGIRGPHPENISGDGGIGGEADVVEGDSQWERETRRRIPRELTSYALATAGGQKNETLIGLRAETAAYIGRKRGEGPRGRVADGE